MNIDAVGDLFREAVYLILLISLPMMLSALIVGLIVAIFQATTQIQEQTLAFVPKIIVIFLVMIFTGSWMLMKLIEFTKMIFSQLVITT